MTKKANNRHKNKKTVLALVWDLRNELDDMYYQLKKSVESFEVVDGEFAGKKFLRGKIYEKIPQEKKHKFERLKSREARKPGGGEASKHPSVQTSKPELEVKP